MKKEGKPMTNITPAALKAAAEGDVDNFIAATTPGGIERQEAAGQAAMVSNFKTLPKEMSGLDCRDFEAGRKIAEAVGFVFGDDVDELFVSVTAPAGWTLKATVHSMHSDVLDEQGAVRGGIFYKAAFYDRKAHGSWNTRYGTHREYTSPGSGDYTLHVRDRRAPEQSLWSDSYTDTEGEDWKARSAREDAIAKGAEAFLDQHYPDWRNPLAYWSGEST